MVIYSMKIANILIDKGFQLKNIGINFKDTSKKVFIFEDSEELLEELKKQGIEDMYKNKK